MDKLFMDRPLMEKETIIKSVSLWLESIVIKLNLCPFAKRELLKNSIRFAVTEARTKAQLLNCLEEELQSMEADTAIETTLLIHPRVLQDFLEFNQFLDDVEDLLLQSGYEGSYQVASFHPDYQFFDTASDDVENYTNRSPYPILHILREASLEVAISSYDDAENIPTRNIEHLGRIGVAEMRARLESCMAR